MVRNRLLTFEAFPERVALEGIDGEVSHGLAMLMARVSDDEADDGTYRVVGGGVRASRRLAASSVPCRRRPWHRHIRRDGEDLLVMAGGRVHLAPGGTEALMEWAGTGAVTDGFVAISLLEAALIHALATGGYVVNHAAAVAVEGAEVLIVGPSRVGKSTLSAAVLAAGGAVVSDDSVILGLDDEGIPTAGALRRDLWLRDGSVEILPETLRTKLWETSSFGERRWGLERAAFPELFRTRVRPQAIVLLRRDLRIRGFELRSVSAADGLAGLILASSPLFLSARYPMEQEKCMPALLALVNGAPCFEVRMGRVLVADPVRTVRRLVEEVQS